MAQRQMTFRDAVAARDQGMAWVEAKAEEVCDSFAERARAFVVDYLRENGPASGETIVLACVDAGIEPHDDRAFGPVFLFLARKKIIVKVGKCKRKRGHMADGGNVWNLATY